MMEGGSPSIVSANEKTRIRLNAISCGEKHLAGIEMLF
jgi:hypothetical protein